MSNFKGFSSVKLSKPQRSQFDMTHTKRISTRMGRLTPVLIMEAVPSDTFRINIEILMRLAPLIAPIYDEIQLYVHCFFVPNRLLWSGWEEFITGGRLGTGPGLDPEVAPVPPFIDIGEFLTEDPEQFGSSSLLDYLGVPPLLENDNVIANWDGVQLDLMPALAYQLVWKEYYRDRNFVEDTYMPFPVDDGEHTYLEAVDYTRTKLRSYMHDYFTSALPFTQRGAEVLMPMAGTGSVTYLDTSLVKKFDGTEPDPAYDYLAPYAVTGPPARTELINRSSAAIGFGARIENIDEINFDGSTVSINDFRTAYALQVWFERNAVGGSRYTESTQAHFGVRPQDSRLQRPEYIGGMRVPVKISEVVSTAWAQADDGSVEIPQANMSGHGVSYGSGVGLRYFCPEHGFIIGIASVMNPPTYHQGMPRMFYRRRSFLDYPWPTFAKLGEQPVDKAEIYALPGNLTPSESGEYTLFGYQSRYADWKYVPNTLHGQFHSALLFWTLARHFEEEPELGALFNYFDDETQTRIFAVNGGEDNLWMYVRNSVDVRRPLPYFGVPNTLGFS